MRFKQFWIDTEIWEKKLQMKQMWKYNLSVSIRNSFNENDLSTSNNKISLSK